MNNLTCPHCGGTNIFAAKRGFKIGRALVFLPLGFAGMNKIELTCLDCNRVSLPGGEPKHQELTKEQGWFLFGLIVFIIVTLSIFGGYQ